ncbi:MAG: phospholipid scramblase-related protein [Bdellovibrionota bacterium]
MQNKTFYIRQKKNWQSCLDWKLGISTKSKNQDNQPVMFCAEMQKGFLGFIMRMFLGHWRTFELHFFNMQRQLLFKANHPFRFIFQRLDVHDAHGKPIGSIEWKWGIFKKRFAIYDFESKKHLQIESGFLSFWTFPILDQGKEVAKVQKKWSGGLKEVFTDADNFRLDMQSDFSENQQQLLLALAIFIDLQYFERKAG